MGATCILAAKQQRELVLLLLALITHADLALSHRFGLL